MISESTQELIVVIGAITPLLTIYITAKLREKEISLKEKEIQQKITLNKQQELFSKEIEMYQELYLLAIKYEQQKHQINLEIPNAKVIQYETDFSLYVYVVEEIFHLMKENIFYVNDKLDSSYRKLFDLYEREFVSYNNRRRLNYHDAPTTEEEELHLNAQKRFYNKNRTKIEDFIEQIKVEFKEKKEILK